MKKKRLRSRSARGQSITEYGACIAFVGCLIAMAFSYHGSLRIAVSTSYVSIATAIDRLNSAANNP